MGKASALLPSEIRDYLARAPKKWELRGSELVNSRHARLVWLSSIAHGTLHERINRRAGITCPWRPYCNPVTGAIRRNGRNNLRKAGVARRPL